MRKQEWASWAHELVPGCGLSVAQVGVGGRSAHHVAVLGLPRSIRSEPGHGVRWGSMLRCCEAHAAMGGLSCCDAAKAMLPCCDGRGGGTWRGRLMVAIVCHALGSMASGEVHTPRRVLPCCEARAAMLRSPCCHAAMLMLRWGALMLPCCDEGAPAVVV